VRPVHHPVTATIAAGTAVTLGYQFIIDRKHRPLVRNNLRQLRNMINLTEFKQLNPDVLDKISLHQTHYLIEDGYATPYDYFPLFLFTVMVTPVLLYGWVSLIKWSECI